MPWPWPWAAWTRSILSEDVLAYQNEPSRSKIRKLSWRVHVHANTRTPSTMPRGWSSISAKKSLLRVGSGRDLWQLASHKAPCHAHPCSSTVLTVASDGPGHRHACIHAADIKTDLGLHYNCLTTTRQRRTHKMRIDVLGVCRSGVTWLCCRLNGSRSCLGWRYVGSQKHCIKRWARKKRLSTKVSISQRFDAAFAKLLRPLVKVYNSYIAWTWWDEIVTYTCDTVKCSVLYFCHRLTRDY